MPLALLIIGLLMIAVGGRGTYAQFGSMVATDFTVAPSGGGPTFGIWLIALVGIGAVGYIPNMQTISRMLLALVLLVLILRNKGFFDQFQAAIKAGPTPPQTVAASSGDLFNIGIDVNKVAGAVSSSAGATLGGAAQSTGAGTVNSWLQSIPGIGPWFAPPAPGSAPSPF